MKIVTISNRQIIKHDIPFDAIHNYLKQMAICKFGERNSTFPIRHNNWYWAEANNNVFNQYINMLTGMPSYQWQQLRIFLRMLIVLELRSLVLTGECDVELLKRIAESDKYFWSKHPMFNTHETKLLN